MRKIFVYISLITIFALIACSSPSGGGDVAAPPAEESTPAVEEPAPSEPEVKNPLTVRNIQFDSLTYKLSAYTNAPDGTKITLTCNNLSQTALAKGGKISLTYETPFYRGIKGGKSYYVRFSADGYSDAIGSVNYWPKVICNARAKDEVNVFCGGNDNFVTPAIDVVNYEASAVSISQSFKVFSSYKNNSLTSDSTGSWTLDDVRAFLKNKVNAGKSVEITSVVSPSNGDSNLKETLSVVYHCKNEEDVALVQVEKDYECYEAILYKELYNYDSETAGGNVSFQWQKMNADSTTYSDIAGATGKTFSLTSSNASSLLQGYIRVKITQKFEDPTKQDINLESEPYLVSHTIKDAQVYYDGPLYEGETFDDQKVRGKVCDELGNWHDVNPDDLHLISEFDEENYYLASASKTFRIQIDSSDFYMDVLDVYATVQQVLKSENVPRLKTASSSVEAGLAEFESINADLEISYDGGATYSNFPAREFEVPANRILYLRKIASGSPNTEGYRKESQPYMIIVKDENIGKKTSGGGLIDGISVPTLTLVKTYDNDKVYVTPKLDIRNPEDYDYEYNWYFDDKPLSEWNGKGVSLKNTGLVIDRSKFGSDTYQIWCSVSITNRSTSYTFVTVSAQISLVIN